MDPLSLGVSGGSVLLLVGALAATTKYVLLPLKAQTNRLEIRLNRVSGRVDLVGRMVRDMIITQNDLQENTTLVRDLELYDEVFNREE